VSIVVVGLSHRTTPLDLLERVSVSPDDVPKALAAVTSCDHVREAMVLATCNRTELYAVVEKFHPAVGELREVLCRLGDVAAAELEEHLLVLHDADAVRHLFAVASGLTSAVLGEHEVLGQVRTAQEVARAEGTLGPLLDLATRQALVAGKRARTETAIARNVASVSSAAVAMAAERLGSLEDRSVLVVGAGEMGSGMVKALVDAGVSDVRIANRTEERARELAEAVKGTALPLSALGDALVGVDVLLTSTGASSLLLDHDVLAASVLRRGGRKLLIVDVAVPRDVDPDVGALRNVDLLDMDDLRAFANAGRAERAREVTRVEAIVAEEVERFLAARSAREMAPLVSALRDRAEELRAAELDRFSARLGDLDHEQREAVDAVTRAVLNKLLHHPSVELKEAAGTARGDRLADSVRELFDL
jgi:glutamyl-tRNA reductase